MQLRKLSVLFAALPFWLSATDVFWVPKQNEYALANESRSEAAEFVFVNVRSDYCSAC